MCSVRGHPGKGMMSVYGYGSREVIMATQNTRTAEGRPLKGVRVYKA